MNELNENCPRCQWGNPDGCLLTVPCIFTLKEAAPGRPTTRDDTPTCAIQIGGDHYKSMAIQPFEYITANGIGFAEGSVIKYVSRWRAKNGIEDLKKARHFLDLLIEHEERTT